MQEAFVGKASELDGDVWVEHDGTKIQSLSNLFNKVNRLRVFFKVCGN